jgi:hypothetical protein
MIASALVPPPFAMPDHCGSKKSLRYIAPTLREAGCLFDESSPIHGGGGQIAGYMIGGNSGEREGSRGRKKLVTL